MHSLTKVVPALALAAALLPGTPAQAAPLTLLAHGDGRQVPGLTGVPTYQEVRITFRVMAGAAGNQGVVATDCLFVGSSTVAETDLKGSGSGVLGSCTSGSVSGNLTYERTASVVTFRGTLVVNGQPYLVSMRSHGGGHCMYFYTDHMPSTTYAVVCDFLYP